jgi:F0F1-type ATP synthase assembly protein I
MGHLVFTDDLRVGPLTLRGGIAHGSAVLLLLLAPTIVGVVLDRYLTTSPWGLAVGAGIGVVAASVITTRTFLRRVERLAPSDAEEDTS